MKLQDKTILIAGASSGIGRQVALLLSGGNNRLVVVARREELLQSLVTDIEANGSQAIMICADALDPTSAAECIAKAKQSFGRIDVALLNIGDGPAFNMSKTGVAEIKQNLDLNYGSLVNFLIPLIEVMKQQQHGLIAHTNSLAGFLGLPMQGPYSAAKAAARILMDTCRLELASFNITFVSLYPGFVATDRVAEDGIPAPFEISEAKAAEHMVRGIEKEKADYLFPFVTASLVRLALILPKPVTGYVLKKLIPADY